MLRRQLLKSAAALPFAAGLATPLTAFAAAPRKRVRPGDPGWPDAAQWAALGKAVGGRLSKVSSPLVACAKAPDPAACDALFKSLRNPFFIGDDPALTQTLGWTDAWTSRPSEYVVAPETAADAAAAVAFAARHNLRLVVKGGGHSYLGGSNAADSLLIWTKRMKAIELHEAFTPKDCEGRVAPQPAVSLGAGCLWLEAYDAVTTKGGRYVQGGGCTTVGVAGLVQGGGFGSFSKGFGAGAANLLEAEVVTADGQVRIANACTNADLFFALKGGGGGTFGVVSFARTALISPHWGEQIRFQFHRKVAINMVFQGLSQAQAQAAWKPFFDWVAARPDDYAASKPQISAIPARLFWNPAIMGTIPGVIRRDDRPGAPASHFLWDGDAGQVGQVLHAYQSAWLPKDLLEPARQPALVDALIHAAATWSVSLHFNKGLAGAPAEALERTRETAMNPAVLDAFALAITGAEEPPAYPGIAGHEPDVAEGRRQAATVRAAMAPLLALPARPASYISETDYFQPDWQTAFWGEHYPRLKAVKRRYDPEGLFFVHHSVGSDEWSEDGFTRKA